MMEKLGKGKRKGSRMGKIEKEKMKKEIWGRRGKGKNTRSVGRKRGGEQATMAHGSPLGKSASSPDSPAHVFSKMPSLSTALREQRYC